MPTAVLDSRAALSMDKELAAYTPTATLVRACTMHRPCSWSWWSLGQGLQAAVASTRLELPPAALAEQLAPHIAEITPVRYVDSQDAQQGPNDGGREQPCTISNREEALHKGRSPDDGHQPSITGKQDLRDVCKQLQCNTDNSRNMT